MLEALSNNVRSHWDAIRQLPFAYWIFLGAYSLIGFGSPMPSHITWLEILVGSGLFIGGLMLIRTALVDMRQVWQSCVALTLGCLVLIVPASIAVFHDHVARDILRDVFPLLFLLGTPILFVVADRTSERGKLLRLIPLVILIVGIVEAVIFWLRAVEYCGSLGRFASIMQGGLLQFLLNGSSNEIIQLGKESIPTIQILGMYDPAVFFSSIFLCSWGMVLVVRSFKDSILGIVFLGAGAFIGYELMVLGLRSYTFLLVLSLLVIASTLIKQSGLYKRLLPIVLILVLIFFSQIEATIQLLWIKQQAVGTNGKSAEWAAALSTISASPWTTLFGIGWGGTLDNPILAAPTRFTHSMLSFFLLKSGIIGLTALFVILTSLVRQARSKSVFGIVPVSRLIILASCFPPLLVGILFEPSYKMLSYGVILTLCVLSLPSLKEKSKTF